MKRLFTFFLVATALSWAMQAQTMTKATPAQARAMIARINSAAQAVKTISCSFTQEKKMSILNDKMVSSGRMCYSGNGKLRWEYTSPYSYIFVINNNQVTMKSGTKTSSVNISSSQLFQAIARIMVSSVTGKSLNNSRDFDVTMYYYQNQWCAHLVPKEPGMKKMFKFVRLYFNTSQTMVHKVEMAEKNGDKTIIRLNNVVTNKPIADAQFLVD